LAQVGKAYCPFRSYWRGESVCPGSGEFTSPRGSVKPPLHQTDPLPGRANSVKVRAADRFARDLEVILGAESRMALPVAGLAALHQPPADLDAHGPSAVTFRGAKTSAQNRPVYYYSRCGKSVVARSGRAGLKSLCENWRLYCIRARLQSCRE